MDAAVDHVGQRLAERVNRGFDAIVCPFVRFGSRRVDSWRFCSLAAFGTATVVWVALVLARGLPIAAVLAPPLVSATIFGVRRRQIITSRRGARLVLHRHVAANAAVLVPLLSVLDSLTWSVFDAMTTALLVGAAVGRLGCLRSGCCTGRPSAIGPRYPWLGSGHRRWPVQLLDSGICVLLAIATAVCAAAGAHPGTGTAVGLGGYLAIRFLLDELRDERARVPGHTEAQRVAMAAAFVGAVSGMVALAVGLPM